MTKSFHTTCWTQVLDAHGNSENAREALRDLCEHYYQPVIAYLQHAESLTEDEARNISHDFFAELLAGEPFENLDRSKGKFRSYLLGALKHFLSRHRRCALAEKRGGSAERISLDEQPHISANQLPPDRLFDHQWAIALLARALDQVEVECHRAGQQALFATLSPWLTGAAEYGDQAQLAKQAGIPANTLKSHIHRLRKRFRDAVKAEIRITLNEDADVDDEMAALFEALRGE